MPKSVTISAPAKVNLCLDIIGKDQSGYHKIQTIFHELSELADEVQITESKQSDNLTMPQHPLKQEDNLAFKALQLVKQRYDITDRYVHIHITKNIPLAAGLGGASSDAAAVIKGLNQLWDLRLETEEMQKLAAELGMDVPFFILGGTAFGTHYGERIQPLSRIKGLKVELIPDRQHRALTASQYADVDLQECGKNTQKTVKMLEAISRGDTEEIIKNLHNDFGQNLTGSGPTHLFLTTRS
ncbi:4-(cytidine 5'-diphospho)-2-C-methyl-D-erythritol kinase [Candidatus Gracilibacteria bacterium]|nr:4-(cytidine 5'-diphospho)-2-C-methyl-D-erythritol kinase [Candidatus Gracilibacteria bacterium]